LGQSKFAIVEFSDYECPFCRQFTRTTFHAIRRELIDTGRAAYIRVALPLERIHPNARKASEAAECAAGDGRFWEMHERLFWLEQVTPLAIADLARSMGLNEDRFGRCLGGEMSERIAADIKEAKRLDITATPTFLLGTIGSDGAITVKTRFNGPLPLEDFVRGLKDLSTADPAMPAS
jgi:protein-disulfide isomerase